MRAGVIAVAYSAPFLTFVLISPGYEAIFLAIYATFLLASLALPLTRHELSEVRTSSVYKGLAGATVGLLIISLYLEFLFGLLQQDPTRIVAATWVFFSLIFPTASALSVSRLGFLLKEDGPNRLKEQENFPTGAQHFALEYCTLRWFRHSRYLLLSLASFAMYFYGWFLLGFPFLLYSVPLIVFSSILLGSLSRRFLAPFTPSDILRQVEQKNRGTLPHPIPPP
jgi:hypothetical protein